MNKKNKCIYQGYSLEEFMNIKSILLSENIPFSEKIETGGGLKDFFVKLFIVGQGRLGLNLERSCIYNLYVCETNYDRAKFLLKSE